MWTYPDDNTSPVITAREHIFAPHSGASAPELPETALLFYMGGAIEHLLNTRPCVQLAEKLPRFLYGCPVYGYRGVCFLDGGRGAPQAASSSRIKRWRTSFVPVLSLPSEKAPAPPSPNWTLVAGSRTPVRQNASTACTRRSIQAPRSKMTGR